MSAASWFRLSKRALTVVLSKSTRRQSPRRPTHSRPFLECLEERIVPDGASGNLGIVTNGAVNFQSGITLVPNPPSADLSGVAVGVFTSPLNASGALDLAQSGLGLPGNIANFTQTAFGFGSGTQPGQPWVPNAYNLGLANQQGAYPTLADRGFQAPPPWVRQIAHLQEKNADTDPDEPFAPPRTFLAGKDSAQDDNQADEIPTDEETGVRREERINPDNDSTLPPLPLLPHAATETNDAEAATNIRSRAAKPIPREAVAAWYARDENAVVEETPFAEKWKTPEAAVPDDEPSFIDSDAPQDMLTLASLNLPSALLLSVLTPAQMMALLMEFPVADAPRDDGEEMKLLSEAK